MPVVCVCVLQAVAAFFRGHLEDLDKAALGEYFGAHENFEVAAMHAFIDQVCGCACACMCVCVCGRVYMCASSLDYLYAHV